MDSSRPWRLGKIPRMSGRRREVPMSTILARTETILVIDCTSLEHNERTRKIPIERPRKNRSFHFQFDECSAVIKELVHGDTSAPALQAGHRIAWVSIAVDRAKRYQYYEARDGTRKIMYHDYNPAFQTAIEGDAALLLLQGHDPELGAYLASMGMGLLPFDQLSKIESLREQERRDDPLGLL